MTYQNDTDPFPGGAPDKQVGPVFGFAEFWPKVYGQFNRQFEAIADLMRLGDEMVKTAEEGAAEPVKNVICALASATMAGACEALLLSGNGCGMGAMKIVRGMYESRWTAEYLRRHPKETEDYIEFSKVILWRRLEWLQGHDPSNANVIDSSVKSKVEDDFDQVKARFPDGRGKVRFQWSKKSIRAIAKEIGREKEYDLPYAIACSIHHGNFEGLSAHFAFEDGEITRDPPPSRAWVRTALLAVHVNLWFVLGTLNDSCGLNFHETLDDAHNVLVNVWKR